MFLVRYFVLILFSFILYPVQIVSGQGIGSSGSLTIRVLDAQSGFPLGGALVMVPDHRLGSSTDSLGNALLVLPASVTDSTRMIVSAVSFDTDSLWVKPNSGTFTVVVRLQPLATETIEITGRRGSKTYSSVDARTVETLHEGEFEKAACCNLSESFETNATIDATVSDAVTGKKEIQLLGLAGRYANLQVNNLPLLAGLHRTGGLDYIPGVWVQQIAISKGIGSVTAGHDGMTGELNIALREPEATPRLFLNGYANHMGRSELNLITGQSRTDGKLSANLMLHGSGFPQRIDHNDDGFLDSPLYGTGALASQVHYRLPNGWQGEWGMVGSIDRRFAGQTTYDFQRAVEAQPQTYGVTTAQEALNVFAKNGYVFRGEKKSSFGSQVAYSYLNEHSTYGRRRYTGIEHRAALNLIFTSRWSEKLPYTAGVSTGFSLLDEALDSIRFERNEVLAGAFIEQTWKPNERLTAVGGLRVDRHSVYGVFVQPRLHLRWQPLDGLTLRASGGRAFRSPNPLREAHSVFVSSRAMILNPSLSAEDAWNTGASMRYQGEIGHERAWSVGIDYFHTFFLNQVVLDEDASPRSTELTNVRNKAYSHAVQAETEVEVLHNLRIRMAYKYIDARTVSGGALRPTALVPNHRGLVNISWERGAWKLDATLNGIGSMRLPITQANPEVYRLPERSPAFATLSAQVTRAIGAWDVYIGGENLTNFRQLRPIVAADQPFSPYFDASMTWGPIMGTVIYAGFRYKRL
jgi:outer membrane cobalamin receptor